MSDIRSDKKEAEMIKIGERAKQSWVWKRVGRMSGVVLACIEPKGAQITVARRSLRRPIDLFLQRGRRELRSAGGENKTTKQTRARRETQR